jgi:4-hydroxy-tetrahydrodipicolinate synthase
LDSERYRGIFGVTVTPFSADGTAVDENGVGTLVQALLGDHITRLVACGNTGEYYALTAAERRRVAVLTVEAAGRSSGTTDPSLIVIGVGGATADARAEAEHAARIGADAVMIHHPSNPHITPDGLVAYCRAIAEASPLPVIPYLRSAALDADGVRRLADIDGVVAVKYAVNDLPAFAAAVDATRDRLGLQWICGTAERWAPFFWAAGAVGFTSGLVNVTAAPALALLAALERGDRGEAMRIWAMIEPFERLRARSADGYNVAVVKAAMRQVGRAAGPVRAPASEVTAADEDAIAAILLAWADDRADDRAAHRADDLDDDLADDRATAELMRA